MLYFICIHMGKGGLRLAHLVLKLKQKLRKNKRLYDILGRFYGLRWNVPMQLARALRGLDDNMAVFSSLDYRSYSDNPRFVSEALHEMRPRTDIVWLIQDGEEARKRFDIPDYVRIYKSTSIAGVCAMARARVVVDSFNKKFYLKFPGKGQIYIQVWHGDRAFKKVGYDNPDFNFRMLEEHCSLCVTGSDYGDMQARSAFHYKGEILRVGCPRNDMLIRNDPAERAAVRARLKLDDDTRVLLYAPTFRDTDRRARREEKVRLDLLHVLDTLERSTGKRWKCLVRAHYMAVGISIDAPSDRLIPASGYPEMAELLLASDALLSDYSSCAGDFALLRRPIYLYQDDLEEYQKNDRGMYIDAKSTPYWIATTPEELDALIERTTPERAKENCDAVLRFYNETETGHAARSVCEYIVSHLRPA